MAQQASQFLIQPNRSLSRRGMVRLFGVLLVVLLGIGTGFAAIGAWLVLPFTGLELLVVGSALAWLARRSGDYELLEVGGDDIVLTRQALGQRQSMRLPRYWAQVVLDRETGRLGGTRLLLRSHGREVEIGASLTDEDKRSLAECLRRLVGFAYK